MRDKMYSLAAYLTNNKGDHPQDVTPGSVVSLRMAEEWRASRQKREDELYPPFLPNGEPNPAHSLHMTWYIRYRPIQPQWKTLGNKQVADMLAAGED